MYVEKKRIGNNLYHYARISVRCGKVVKTKTVAYLGKEPMTHKEINEKMKKIPKKVIAASYQALKTAAPSTTAEITAQFHTIEQLKKLSAIKKEFSKKCALPDKKLIEDMFKDFKTNYVYNTNAIEGNTLTLEETQMLLNENKTPEGKDLHEIYDHLNEKETFDYTLKEKPEINGALIIKLHAQLLNKIDIRIGGFRTQNVRVFGADFETTEARYVTTDMNLLLKWYHQHQQKLHPLILAALFHEKFERIHPFYDGNGRTGRMLLNLILLRKRYPPLIIKNKDRKEYYRVLSLGHKGDLLGIQVEHYKALVTFCYTQLLTTYETIFSRWG